MILAVWCDTNAKDDKVHTRMEYFTIVRPQFGTAKGLFKVLESALCSRACPRCQTTVKLDAQGLARDVKEQQSSPHLLVNVYTRGFAPDVNEQCLIIIIAYMQKHCIILIIIIIIMIQKHGCGLHHAHAQFARVLSCEQLSSLSFR